MRLFYLVALIAFVFLCAPLTGSAQFPAGCDQDKSCVGNALTTQITSGRGAQYVDVDSSYRVLNIRSAITFEAWIKPQPQPGMRQFLGGLWGPNKDDNDQWVVYIEDNRVVFALSADGTRLQDADNTIAAVDLPDLYTRGWVHVAAVWDGASTAARLYIDGFEAARAVNPTYPLTRLHPVANKNLLMQIGSCNGLYDDPARFRTFLGQIDEVRLWNRDLTPFEVRCWRNLSLQGNEAGLVLYYRCNENQNGQTLCDATGNRITGRMRSGARCEESDRTIPTTYTVTPTSLSGTLVCTSDTSFSFTITDTSYCGSQVRITAAGRDGKLFTPSPALLNLQQNVPQTFTVQMKATIIGTITAELQIVNVNRCGNILRVPINFTRRTELDYSDGQIELDTLYVGCVERPFAEKQLTVTNNTGRSMKVDSIAFTDTIFHWRPDQPSRTLPTVLNPGEAWSFHVRMNAADTTMTSTDTIRIYSDDRCPGSGVIPVTGNTVDVLLLLKGDGSERIDSMTFEAVCPNQISNVQTYQYRSGVNEPIRIDTIEFDQGFFGRRSVFPIPLLPMTAYPETFVRFRPNRPGPFTGEMRVRTSYRGCTIVKKIHLSGYGIDVNFGFDAALIGFGNVTIGKRSTQSVNVVNNGDPRRLSAYLKYGDVFRITAGRSFSLGKGGSGAVTVEFRPREPITYYDTLCVFDEECFSTMCIPVSGTGVFEALSFEPPYLSLSNVIGCQCRNDSVVVKNITAAPVVVSSVVLNDATGKFSVVSLFTPGTLQPGESRKCIIRYCPSDLTDDRADVAYIDLDLDDGQKYQILLRGSSAVPKIYVTPLTTYGNVEIGTTKTDRILIENISTVPLEITSINPPAGYTVISTSRTVPATLQPRDSLLVDVQFAPTQETLYDGFLNVTSTTPCGIAQTGRLTGRGIIYRLDVPLSFINFGLIRPCDCAEREIPLPNGSSFKPIEIDSIWIDGRFVTNPNPIVYSWRSKLTGGRTLPYSIPPGATDTLVIGFCPNIPAVAANLVADAKLHIRSHTVDWSREDTVTMSGRREMNFQPNRTNVNFPNIRAGFSSGPQIVEITVPDEFLNPSGDSLVITDITFNPDQRVFTASAVNGAPFPWVIKRGDTFRIRVIFSPRAPRLYIARMQIHTSFPCKDMDTTVLVRGEGFAFPYGMRIAFDTSSNGLDTFDLTTCDTLLLPIIADRDMPQDRIDIQFRVGYDSTLAELVDVSSRYSTNITVVDTGDGGRITLREAFDVKADTIAWVRFAPKVGDTILTVYLDEVDFDSDSLVLYKIVVPPDSAFIMVSEPRIAVTSMTRFDTVNIRDCLERIVAVSNPGRIPVSFDTLTLPLGHTIVASSIPYPTTLNPGDTIHLTVRFCPFREELYDTTILAHSSFPCPIADTGRIYSFGYAPPFPFRLALDPNIGTVDTIRGTIADTVTVTIISDRDIPQTPLDVGFTLQYNRRALQFLDISSTYSPGATASGGNGGLRVSLPGCDSIAQGEIARLRFQVAVPDSILSPMRLAVEGSDFTSDSAFWVKLIPQGDTGAVQVDSRCNITRLDFAGGANKLSPPTPNPTGGVVVIEVAFFEDARAKLILYNSAGVEVTRLLDGGELLPGGRYRLEFDTSELPTGSYFYVLEAAHFTATERLQVIR